MNVEQETGQKEMELNPAQTKEAMDLQSKTPKVDRENRETVGDVRVDDPRMRCTDINVHYGDKHAIKGLNLDVGKKEILSMIGPSGCGKSTFLRCLNRMNDTIDSCRVTGTIEMDGVDINGKSIDVVPLRASVGMVFQKPTPFPMSIFDNVAFGVRLYEKLSKADLAERVEWALKKAALWDEVKNKLNASGLSLSGGQQQRLCIARGVATKPEVLLLDEPTSALDPISTGAIEDLIEDLKQDYTIAIVTHNMQQAARISDYTAYMYLGDMVEIGKTDQVFTNPTQKATEDYITGRYG